MPTGSPEKQELFLYNSKRVFDVYISKVYPVLQDEMDFTFQTQIKGVLVHFNSSVLMIRKRTGHCCGMNVSSLGINIVVLFAWKAVVNKEWSLSTGMRLSVL